MTTPAHYSRKKQAFYVAAMVFCLVAATFWMWRTAGKAGAADSLPFGKKSAEAVMQERLAYFEEKILPLVEDNRRRNAQATVRFIDRLESQIAVYRAGIGPFIEDVTGWGTRIKTVWYLPGDKMFDKQSGTAMIQEKFNKHLFSDEKLRQDLEHLFVILRDEFEANQNQLIAEARAAADGSPQSIRMPDLKAFSEAMRAELLIFAQGQAKDSAVNGVATFVVSGAVGELGQRLIMGLIARAGASAATGAVVTSGASAGGAGGGAAIGSAGGPAGTVAGFAVGMVIGFAVDWWMTDEFKTKTSAELNHQLDQLRDNLLEGGEGHAGLVNMMKDFRGVVGEVHTKQLRDIFVVP